jgi:hypothetical protein
VAAAGLRGRAASVGDGLPVSAQPYPWDECADGRDDEAETRPSGRCGNCGLAILWRAKAFSNGSRVCFKEAHAISAGAFGGVHCGIGLVFEFARRLSFILRDRHANTHRTMDGNAFDNNTTMQRPAEPVGNLTRQKRGNPVGNDHDELISSDAAEKIAVPQTALKPICHLAKIEVADAVAVVVVHGFEVVKVEEKKGHRSVGLARMVERFLESRVDQDAIGKAGKLIVLRTM